MNDNEVKIELTRAQIHAGLTEAARIENDKVLKRLIKSRAQLEGTIAELTMHIEAMSEPAQIIRQELKCALKEIVAAGGTVDYALVTVARRKKWEYDRVEAANWAEEFEPQTVKISLKVREFEKLLPLQMDDTVRFHFEQVEVVDIKLPKDLGHLLITDSD